MSRVGIVVVCSALVLACSGPQPHPAPAEAPEASAPQAADRLLARLGETEFGRHCASCHGVDARGDGPVARSLQTPPADLRRISQRRGGAFPDAEIARKIDGRFEISAHGSREMPVWGRVFSADMPDTGTAESITRGKLAVLVEYLKSIQDPQDAPASPDRTRQSMGEIFEAMRTLLPLSLSEEGFEDPVNGPTITAALEVLDRSSAGLGQHGASGDVSFAHLARSLAIDARDVRIRYQAGNHREARYLVQTLTETCVACHSRLPGASAPRSEAFAREIAVVTLPLEQRAKLAYATRQFDVALDHYETLLASREISATALDLGGHLDDYLELVIRVKREPKRAASALSAFAGRDDLSPALREEVASWVTALARITSAPQTDSPIATARALSSDTRAAVAGERHVLIEQLEASGLLHRALGGALAHEDRAEAYFLLGRVETQIGRSYWLSQAEAYLETAIRLAPGEPIAADAYELLEEFLVAGYSGSGGTYVPPDVQAKLDQLRQIADSKR